MFKRGRTVRLTATEDAWAAPTMMALEGGSFGLRIGAEETDFVLLVINESGARGILAGKVKLGGDASIARIWLAEMRLLRPTSRCGRRS